MTVASIPRLPAIGVISTDSLTRTTIAIALFVPGHIFSWALEWAWLGFQLLVAVVILMKRRNRLDSTVGIPAAVWIMVFLVVSGSGCLSAIYGYINFQITPIYPDLTDLLRFFIFIPLVLYVGTAVKPRHAQTIVQFFKICVLLNLACAAILVFDIEPLFTVVEAIYRDAKINYDITHIRIGIPFVNPNFAALLYILILSTFLFFERSIVFALLAVIAILLTGSRSGYLSAAPLLLLAYAMFAVNAFQNWRLGSIFVLAHIGGAAYFVLVSEVLEDFSRLNELLEALQGRDIAEVDTASIRFDLINNALQYIQQSPLLGVGPGRSLGLDVVDNQLIGWPLNYGIPIAIVLYSLFLAPMLLLAWQAHKPIHKFAAMATGLSFFLMLGTGDFIKNYRLFFLVLVIMQCIRMLALQVHSADSKLSSR